MPYLNAVVEAIQEGGHVASFKGKDHHVPQKCKRCDQLWPCEVIRAARNVVRRLHGVKVLAA